jgi:hypothetical protein
MEELMSRHDDLYLITLGSDGAVHRDARGEPQLDLFDALYEHVPERSQLLAEGHGLPSTEPSRLLRELFGEDSSERGYRMVSKTPSRSRRRKRRRAA